MNVYVQGVYVCVCACMCVCMCVCYMSVDIHAGMLCIIVGLFCVCRNIKLVVNLTLRGLKSLNCHLISSSSLRYKLLGALC